MDGIPDATRDTVNLLLNLVTVALVLVQQALTARTHKRPLNSSSGSRGKMTDGFDWSQTQTHLQSTSSGSSQEASGMGTMYTCRGIHLSLVVYCGTCGTKYAIAVPGISGPAVTTTTKAVPQNDETQHPC